MSDFELFSQALNKYKNKNIQEKTNESDVEDEKEEDGYFSHLNDQECDENDSVFGGREGMVGMGGKDEKSVKCEHVNIASEKGVDVCTDCGEEITPSCSDSNSNKEWRYYGQSDSRRGTDPNRVHARKSEERSIFKDVENMGFSDKIIANANKIYFQVTSGQIFRGNSRKAIVFASIFHAYKISGKPQSHEKLINAFNLSRKTGLKGLKHVNLYAPKDISVKTTYITPINLVEEIMDKFSASDEQKKQVIDLYNKIKNRSSRLNRSRPQSTASGVVYYWICDQKKDITIKQFAKKVSLSELTINKIAKEITDIIKSPEE